MNKRELMQFFIGLSYNTGYEQARKDVEREAKHKQELEQAYRKGRMAEVAKTDTRRAADIMGGTE